MGGVKGGWEERWGGDLTRLENLKVENQRTSSWESRPGR